MTLIQPTSSPDRARTHRERRQRQLALISCAVAVLLLLASCATEDARDQMQGKQRDASRTAVLSQVQARIAAKPFAATPIPRPTVTPIPIIETLTLTIGVGPDKSPQQQVPSFSTGTSSVYIAAHLHYLRKGEIIQASWRTPDDVEVASSEMRVAADADDQWVAFPLTTQLQPGEYAVYILANGNLLNSLVFTVTG